MLSIVLFSLIDRSGVVANLEMGTLGSPSPPFPFFTFPLSPPFPTFLSLPLPLPSLALPSPPSF